MIVIAAPVIPDDKDGGGVPERRLHNRVYLGHRPVLAIANACLGVIRKSPGGTDPGEVRESVVLQVGDEILWCGDVGRPLASETDVGNAVKKRPDITRLPLTRSVVMPA